MYTIPGTTMFCTSICHESVLREWIRIKCTLNPAQALGQSEVVGKDNETEQAHILFTHCHPDSKDQVTSRGDLWIRVPSDLDWHTQRQVIIPE